MHQLAGRLDTSVIEVGPFFHDAPGGKGNIFSIRAIQSILILRGQKVISIVTSAVAASLLENGRTANSTFNIPIPCFVEIVRSIYMDSKLACTIRQSNLIIWDEIVMCVRYCAEVVDCTLRAIMKSLCVLFGCKCILSEEIFAKSYLWYPEDRDE